MTQQKYKIKILKLVIINSTLNITQNNAYYLIGEFKSNEK